MRLRKKRPIIAVLNDWGTVCDIFENLGAYALDIETTSEVATALPRADAVVFTGGGDINPERYGIDESDRHPQVYGVSEWRDTAEFAAFRMARKHRIPVLGICRGAQLINVGHGGTLHQHIFDGAPADMLSHSGTDHVVKMRRNSRIGRMLGHGVLKEVTSLHHQAVDRLGDGLVPVGWAPDGTVEMIETAPGVRPYMLGTQFHPEMDISSKTADYDPWIIFDTIFDMARQHSISRGGDYYARLAEVDHLIAFHKAAVKYTPPVTKATTPSGQSVAAYLDALPGDHGHGSEDSYAYYDDEEDSYDDWLRRNRVALAARGTSDIDKADDMCMLDTGCQCPLDCLAYGSCSAQDVQNQTIKEVINEMTSEVLNGKRGSRR